MQNTVQLDHRDDVQFVSLVLVEALRKHNREIRFMHIVSFNVIICLCDEQTPLF